MSKLSVIICVYNTNENMFEKCLKSIFNSTIKDLEVIVIDDGSTVDYNSIINKVNVKYFKTENQGTLKARLFGIKKSSCNYVCFVDSDDSVSFNYFEASLSSIKDADIVLNDWAFITQNTKYFCSNDSTINSNFVENYPLKKFFEKQGKEHSYYVLWNKIFKKEVLLSACEEIEKLNIQKLVYAEDVLITYFAFKHAKEVVNTHLGYYFYKLHNNQQIEVHTKEKLISHATSINFVFDEIENDLKINNIFLQFGEDLYAWKQFLCSNMYAMAKKFNSKQINDKVLEKFKNCKLKNISHKTNNIYLNHKLLPNNIEEIDCYLHEIYYSDKFLNVYAKKGSYAFKTLTKMKEMFNLKFNFTSKRNADIILPKEKINLKQKFLHNTFICRIGAFLFPKGSKIRSLIKQQF